MIRNFCIIAHIDHGKSTLADRMLQLTGVVGERQMRAQYLDRMDIERERGITIKSQAVRLPWRGAGRPNYVLNLIDTPGHVDFSYEVSRSLAACEGAILLVDAAQGIEAQTLANLYLALDADLHLIPVLNKIDLPAAQPEKYAAETRGHHRLRPGRGAPGLGQDRRGRRGPAERDRRPGPAPAGDLDAPARALIFDSVYDTYRGVVTYVRVVDGRLSRRERTLMLSTKAVHETLEVGVISPEPVPSDGLAAGEVGYLITGVKDVRQARVGDTVTSASHPGARAAGRVRPPQADGVLRPLPGRRRRLPGAAGRAGQAPAERRLAGLRAGDVDRAWVRLPLRLPRPAAHGDRPGAAGAGVRPVADLDRAERRLPRGPGDRRRDRSSPTRASSPDGEDQRRSSSRWCAPRCSAPSDYIGAIMELCQGRRGVLLGMDYLSADRVEIRYTMPLAEIIFDFFDQLKSRTRGYASLDYEPAGEQEADLVKVDILLQGQPVDAFSQIVHTDKAREYGLAMTARLKELIPRQQFEVPIQAAIGARVIARENIRAMRKDVLAKCYGGDITRKRKLLEKCSAPAASSARPTRPGSSSALQRETGWDPRQATVIVGTSAGSVTGAALRVGVPATDLAASLYGVPTSRPRRRHPAPHPPGRRRAAPDAVGRLAAAALEPAVPGAHHAGRSGAPWPSGPTWRP